MTGAESPALRSQRAALGALALAGGAVVTLALASGTGGAGELLATDPAAEPLAARIETLLPPDWEITAAAGQRAPSRWLGPANAVYVRIEDTAVNIHHPGGHTYHPYIKLFFCPRGWSGTMEETDYYGDVTPAFLLGRNDTFTVFYQTGGRLTWTDAWAALGEAFALAPPRIGRDLRLEVDALAHRRLGERLAAVHTDLSPDVLLRVTGLVKNGSLLYLEYSARVNAPPATPGAPPLDPAVKGLIERETGLLLAEAFRLYPELECAYVRRLCDNRLFDALVERSANGSALEMKGTARAGGSGG